MNKILFTEEFCQPENLRPFTLTRQLQDIRVGILTIREKWEKMLGLPSYDKKEDDYKDLSRAMDPYEATAGGDCFMIHGNILPVPALVKEIKKLKNGECISTPGGLHIAFRFSRKEVNDEHRIKVRKAVEFSGEIISITRPWDIFRYNDRAIRLDFALLTARRQSQPIPRSNKVINQKGLFLEKGAKVEHSIINASEGPVYIGKNALVMEGCLIRGSFALGENACLKMGTRVYGASTLGPSCVGGGEIKNSVLFGYSNKAHDGYLGDAVIGEWCNLGAGTSNSNIKNTAGAVKVWTRAGEEDAGVKCGVIMGDYTRTAINTSINTGTLIGVCCNVFGNGLTPRYIPDFSWGSEGVKRYQLDKAIADIRNWQALKNQQLSAEGESILRYIFEKF